MKLRAQRLVGGRNVTLYVVAFLLAWQILDILGTRFFAFSRLSPIYPDAAADVLFLIVAGWRWWPLIPISGLIHWGIFETGASPIPVLVVQSLLGLGYGLAVRFVERLQVGIPPRSLRDVAYFCGIIGIVAPAVVGIVADTLLVALGRINVEDILVQYSRFVLGDASAIVTLVPATLIFMRWNDVRPPVEHQDPPRAEAIGSIVVTVVLVFASAAAAFFMGEPALDLSFVAVAWLAIRFGLRGAASGIGAALLATIVAYALFHPPINSAIQTEGLLFASSLTGLLLAGLTNERWELLAHMSRRAYVDELTGLPNRERLVEWVGRHQETPIVLIIMDVDDMRLLNQGVGRVAADHVLQEMGIRMRASFPSSYFIARVSADEFAVAVVDDRSPHAIMTELREFFEAPFDADGSRVFISVSMGAVRTIRAGSADELLRKADVALDVAKEAPTRAVVYSPEMQAAEAPSLVGELHRAVERHELVPFFQPIFRRDPLSGRWVVTGAEALMRWMHPERGIVSPGNFIDMLERLAIGDQVGWDIIEQSLIQAGIWRRDIPEFRVWVNLFPRQVLQRDCERRIVDLLEQTGVPADALVVEINEGVIASDERDVTAIVSRLRARGITCAIDDFGTGGSSLGRVRDVPVSMLKIDRSFVNKSEVDSKAKAVAATVVRLAEELGMSVVAEGVENVMQLEVMSELGCEFMQGYALGHPLPADLFTRTFLVVDRASSA